MLLAAGLLGSPGLPAEQQPKSNWGPCELVGEMPGTEDLALYERSDGAHRILISAQDRRREAPGAIWQMAPGGVPEVLFDTVAGEEPLFPHGIAVARMAHDGVARLYVVHHRPKGGQPPHAIVVYRLDGESAGWEATLHGDLLLSPNDLVATASGDLYVTNEIGHRGVLRQALEFLGIWRSSYVAHGRYQPPAETTWERVARGTRYANGVEVDDDHLYVAATLDRALWIFERDSESGAVGAEGEKVPVGSGVDNLTWGEVKGRRFLMTAAHPDLRAFLRHARDGARAAPSEVWRFDPGAPASSPERILRVFEDPEGRRVRAAATAVMDSGRLYLGQVFEPGVLVCVPRVEPIDSAP